MEDSPRTRSLVEDEFPFPAEEVPPDLLVDSFKPMREELHVLAEHYLNEARDNEHWMEATSQYGSDCRRKIDFALARLSTIHDVLGESEYEAATAKTRKHWEKKFAELAATPECEKCGTRLHDPGECPVAEPSE